MPYKYLMYLRKSRQDNPDETVEEVLAKHETMLQDFAKRELGGEIPQECIFREVVSGESIDERVAIKEVLARIEMPEIEGVIVIDPQRLTRGSLRDVDRLINDLRYSHTHVITPMMTYDLEKKMERKFFQDELLRGQEYLDYVKDILWRGRVAAAKRGCYIGAHSLYGYNKVKIGRDHTLEPNDDADTVRMIFDWYVKEGLSVYAIAHRLNELGYTPARGKKWSRDTLRDMLQNVHYIGKIRFNEVKATWVLENGQRVRKYLKQPDDEIIISEGKHPGIVDPEIFAAAQERFSLNAPVRRDRGMVNPLAGILRCSNCGNVMVWQQKDNRPPRFTCRLRPYCCKSARADDIINAIIAALEQAELPALQAKLKNGDGNAAVIQKKRIEKLMKQMEEYRDQEEKQYELLETRKYTQEIFDRRNAALREKIEECEKALHLARQAMPQNVDYEEKIIMLQDAIEALKDKAIPVKEKNRLLRAIIDRIEYTSVDHGFKKTDIKLEVFLRL